MTNIPYISILSDLAITFALAFFIGALSRKIGIRLLALIKHLVGWSFVIYFILLVFDSPEGISKFAHLLLKYFLGVFAIYTVHDFYKDLELELSKPRRYFNVLLHGLIVLFIFDATITMPSEYEYGYIDPDWEEPSFLERVERDAKIFCGFLISGVLGVSGKFRHILSAMRLGWGRNREEYSSHDIDGGVE